MVEIISTGDFKGWKGRRQDHVVDEAVDFENLRLGFSRSVISFSIMMNHSGLRFNPLMDNTVYLSNDHRLQFSFRVYVLGLWCAFLGAVVSRGFSRVGGGGVARGLGKGRGSGCWIFFLGG